jgi:hypothetical protein
MLGREGECWSLGGCDTLGMRMALECPVRIGLDRDGERVLDMGQIVEYGRIKRLKAFEKLDDTEAQKRQ